MAKNCYPVILLSVCKIFETLANDRLVDHPKKDFLHLFYFQYDFRSSGSTADLLTVVSDRIARAYSSCSTRNIQGFLQNFFIKSGLRAFQTEFLSLFLHFSVFSTLSNLMILLFYC